MKMKIEIKPAAFIAILTDARRNDERHPWLHEVDFWLSCLIAASDDAVIIEVP